MRTGNLYIISGPSGTGKGTLVQELLSRVPDIWVSVSATTRPPRPGEIEGVHYFFKSVSEFDELIENDGLLEWAEVHGNRYGTPIAAVRDMMDKGAQVILEIDPQGAMQVLARIPESRLVFIKPPSFEELRRRLEGRGSETPEQIELRLRTAEIEMKFEGKYDVVVNNDDVHRATNEIVAFIDSCANDKKEA
ncbi:MAG: guanylate kinase [Actinomycetota bacterium]|jgi:guanylate kinase|nr:guanylate kinase [Actinomycetota bacterium]